jgi:hypothetical protein
MHLLLRRNHLFGTFLLSAHHSFFILPVAKYYLQSDSIVLPTASRRENCKSGVFAWQSFANLGCLLGQHTPDLQIVPSECLCPRFADLQKSLLQHFQTSSVSF